jgi:hypothetical protein
MGEARRLVLLVLGGGFGDRHARQTTCGRLLKWWYCTFARMQRGFSFTPPFVKRILAAFLLCTYSLAA